MKTILYISNHNPFGTSYGAEQRSNVILKALLANNCVVDLAYIGDKNDCKDTIEGVNLVYWNDGRRWNVSKTGSKLRLLTVNMFSKSSELCHIIQELTDKTDYDFILCRYIQFASLAGLSKFRNKLILDIDDLPYQAFATQISSNSFIKRIYHKMIYFGMKRGTLNWIKQSKVCLLPNKEQAQKLNCTFFPNIPVFENITFTDSPNNILFIGKLDFEPNYRGVDHFIDKCWDNISGQFPDAKFYIAGKGLSDNLKMKWLSHKNVVILGFVDSVYDFYSKGSIVISPIQSGSGTNIKVIEAFAFGKACVLSRFSTKGFDDIVIDGNNCMIFDNDAQCICIIKELLSKSSLSHKVGKAALFAAKESYSQEKVNSIFRTMFAI